jgi:hypothetical protein
VRTGLGWLGIGTGGGIILGWIFKIWDVGVRTGLGWLRIGIRAGLL